MASSDVYFFINTGILFVLFGFSLGAKDVLMFDVRVVRGIHRLPGFILIAIFSIISILFSLSQYLLFSNSSNCSIQLVNNTIHNDQQQNTINFNCSYNYKVTEYIWYTCLFMLSVYIFLLLSHRDYRSAIKLKDKLFVRNYQKKQFIFAFLFGFIILILLIVRFGFVIILHNAYALSISIIVIICFFFVLFFNFRAFSLTNYFINTYTKNDINDISIDNKKDKSKNIEKTKKDYKSVQLTDSSDNSDEELKIKIIPQTKNDKKTNNKKTNSLRGNDEITF